MLNYSKNYSLSKKKEGTIWSREGVPFFWLFKDKDPAHPFASQSKIQASHLSRFIIYIRRPANVSSRYSFHVSLTQLRLSL